MLAVFSNCNIKELYKQSKPCPLIGPAGDLDDQASEEVALHATDIVMNSTGMSSSSVSPCRFHVSIASRLFASMGVLLPTHEHELFN